MSATRTSGHHKEYGALLKKLRESKNLSVQDLADLLNLSIRTIYSLEEGNRLPSDQTVKLLKDVLGDKEIDEIKWPRAYNLENYNQKEIDTSTAGGQLKKWRLAKGLSRRQVAISLNITESAYFNIESNKVKKPSNELLEALGELFSEDVKSLFPEK